MACYRQVRRGFARCPQDRRRVSSPGRERRLGRPAAWRLYVSGGPRWRSASAPGADNGDEPHARDIALRRRAEQATVLATELRRAFVPHTPSGASRVEVLV